MCVIASSQQRYEVNIAIPPAQMTAEVTLQAQGPSASKVESHDFKLGPSQPWLENLKLEGNQLGPERG